MPTYEYQCQECGEHFEVEQRMTDDALTIHDACGGAVKKVFSSVGIVWKGAGFYKTDARGSTTKPAEKKPAEKAGSEAKATTTDSKKPADKAPATPKSTGKPTP